MTKFENEFMLTINGKIQPQQRPRHVNRGGFITTYDPKESADYKKYVAKVGNSEYKLPLIESAIKLTIDFYIEIPKSYTKKKINQISEGNLMHIKKPDIENLAKGIMDGLTGVIWKDDSLIFELHLKKHYSHEPRAEVLVQW